MDKCSEHFGTGTQFQYLVSKVYGRVKLRIIVQGDRYDPLSDKDAENNDVLDFVEQAFGEDKSSFTSYQRFPGRNSITVSSAKQAKKAPIFKSPMLWAIALGVICGLICQRLPDHISTFLIDGLADPIGDIALALIAGVTGPVIFLSLITSISSLGSINRLTDLGFKIMWRFIKCTLFIIAVSIGVSLLFYSVFGSGTIQFSPEQLVSMLLKLIPTNIIEPFLNNNTPQLVILAIALGAALLLMEDRTPGLTASLRTLHMWSTSFMKLVFLVVPVIPFVSVFKAFAAGRMQVLLDGWEFIVGVVVALTICCLVKLIKVSLKCRLRIPVLLKKTMPIASLAFSSGSESATLNL